MAEGERRWRAETFPMFQALARQLGIVEEEPMKRDRKRPSLTEQVHEAVEQSTVEERVSAAELQASREPNDERRGLGRRDRRAVNEKLVAVETVALAGLNCSLTKSWLLRAAGRRRCSRGRRARRCCRGQA